MQVVRTFMGRAAALAAAAGAAVVLAGSPASASVGGFWSTTCNYGRGCLTLANGSGQGGPVWNLDGCGAGDVQDYFRSGQAHGNRVRVTYVNNTWDEIAPWTSRPLDGNNLAVWVYVYC
ncbi:hypothetical protein CF54_14440 [Streptomyces sp. Tu 6176]|uniref:hypothetical protein n=1 Tax=Streptomyces sp. Tu 6176 TaxID=1470557 RepID=UPI00044C2CA9|nr:hypothetical protein [Streptomyces sp. Tu 6176]EYT82250.1 hypothetical protein CF54_14440 [Streptomyces sp. Tu 6176]